MDEFHLEPLKSEETGAQNEQQFRNPLSDYM